MSVFIGYHAPCLDGAYSLLSAFLFFREIQKQGILTSDFLNYISQFENYQSINQTIAEYKTGQNTKEQASEIMEETKSELQAKPENEYSPYAIKDIVYVPLKLNADGSFDFRYKKYSPSLLENSVFILLDYTGLSIKEYNRLSQSFRKVIIIDHHASFEHILAHFQSNEAFPQNIIYHYRKENSGATLSLEFFEKIKGGPLLADRELQQKLLEIVSYVEDHDLRAEKVVGSEEFASGFLSKYNIFGRFIFLIWLDRRLWLDPNSNRDLFKQMLEIDVRVTIQSGEKEQKQRKERAQLLVKKHKRIVYLGGRIKGETGRFGVCYGIETYELDLRSEIGHLLAVESVKDGLGNMGAVYRVDKSTGLYNISLRSLRDVPEGDCVVIARAYGGGGHHNAAGLSVSKAHMKSWL